MPGRDGTGPHGQGAMTGRGLGVAGQNQGVRTGCRQRLGFGPGQRLGLGPNQGMTNQQGRGSEAGRGQGRRRCRW